MSDEKTTRHFTEELQRLKERLLEMGWRRIGLTVP
jgi:hypothetical protein